MTGGAGPLGWLGLLHRRWRGRTADSGVSLVELLVAMMLFGIVMAMLTGLYFSVTKTVSLGRAIDGDTRAASNISTEFGKVLAVGTANKVAGTSVMDPAFRYAGQEQLIVYSNVGASAMANDPTRPSQPTMVKFEVLPTSRLVQESRWTAISAVGSWIFDNPDSVAATSTRTLGGPILATGTPIPLFSYFDVNNVAIAAPVTGTMGDADRKRIASVRTTVRVQASTTASTSPAVVENTVILPNLTLVSP